MVYTPKCREIHTKCSQTSSPAHWCQASTDTCNYSEDYVLVIVDLITVVDYWADTVLYFHIKSLLDLQLEWV